MDSPSPHHEFVRQFAQHERQVYTFILSLLGDTVAADDVFQETCVVLWDKFADFRPGTNFGAWARKIAYHKVLNYRQQRARQLPLATDEFLERVSASFETRVDTADARLKALQCCVRKLSESDRELIRLRYEGDTTARNVARQTGRPENTVYKALSRVRRALLNCIRLTMSQEEHA